MINIVIPMAGAGSRFAQARYSKPKPFIDVNGKPMIVRVIENLAFPEANFILIARKEHLEAEYILSKELSEQYKCTIISLEKETEGTVCSILHARNHINNDHPILIANSDQIIDINIKDFIDDAFIRQLDGSILTFNDETLNPKWSFAKINNEGLVIEVREKDAISNIATVGIYFYRMGKDFVDSALEMIINSDKVNNEYYTCPTFNYMISKNKKIGIYNISLTKMHGIGTPEDLSNYLELTKNEPYNIFKFN